MLRRRRARCSPPNAHDRRRRPSDVARTPKLSHLGRRGEARMVDVSEKTPTERTAVAEGRVVMKPETLDGVLGGVAPLPPETVPIGEASGRVLAQDLAAVRSQPPAAVSAMDGYAVRAADVAGGRAELTLIGEVAAGRPFAGRVGSGQAARIF